MGAAVGESGKPLESRTGRHRSRATCGVEHVERRRSRRPACFDRCDDDRPCLQGRIEPSENLVGRDHSELVERDPGLTALSGRNMQVPCASQVREDPKMARPMRPRLGLMLGALVLSAAAIGCSAANPSLQSSDVVSHRATPTDAAAALPTPTDRTSPIPAVAPEPVRSPLGGCPSPRPDLALILALDPGQRLACFGRSALTFQATAVATEVDCVPIRVDPAWLWCPPAAFLAPPGTAASWPGSDPVAWTHRSAPPDDTLMIAAIGVPTLSVYAAPGSGVDQAQFVPGAIMLVTGHFDDPAAAACRVVAAQLEPDLQVPTAAEVVLVCREAFVVTSVRPGSA